jgi:hypothetical protein
VEKMIGDDDIEDWEDFEEVDLSKKRYVSDDARESYIKAGKNRRQSQEETLKIYKKIHGNKYDYSKVNIITQKTQIEIICKKCNKSFFMKATSHKRRGCPVCALDKIGIANKKLWEDPEKRKHYEEVNRKKVRTPEYRKKYLEGMKNRKSTQVSREELIRRCKEQHGDRFDYSKTVFGTEDEKVSIVCKEHGEFSVIRRNHLRSKSGGCPKCKKLSK